MDVYVSRSITDKLLQSLHLLSADIKLQNIFDEEFLGSVIFGSPAQKTDVMFDTGSASTWVYLMEGC